jgi:hypothetical protein
MNDINKRPSIIRYGIKTIKRFAVEANWVNVSNLFLFCFVIVSFIRKDCFQVKSNLLTVDNLVFHY